jgi:uncharacterized membrane protein YeaQ/YmgE (transglycosylase-associated protein family)
VSTERLWGILWILLIDFIAGGFARLLSPGPNNPSGFSLKLFWGFLFWVWGFLFWGFWRAFVATFLGRAIG